MFGKGEINKMGMFDNVSGLRVKCPKCGKKRDRKWQTKSFVNTLHSYKIGEHVDTKQNTFYCIGVCPICKTMNSVSVKINNGTLTGEYKLIE